MNADIAPVPQIDAPAVQVAQIEMCPLTGLPVIVSPPGTPPLTSEMVYALLEDFP